MRIFLAVAALLAYSAGAAAAQPFSFEYLRSDLVPTVFGSVAWADADLDGKLDVFATGSTTHEPPYAPTSTLYLQRERTGSASQAEQHFEAQALSVSLWHSAAAWNDYDRDGDPDLVVLGAENTGRPYIGRTVLYANDGSGTLSATPTVLPALYAGSADWGDFDNDGDVDLLLTGVSGDRFTTALMRNDNGAFVVVDAGLTDVGYGTARFGDYDGDRDLDVAIVGQAEDGYVTKVFNNDAGSFSEVSVAGGSGVAYSAAAWGDHDDDGDLDLLITGGQISEQLYSGHSFVLTNFGGRFVRQDLPDYGVLAGTAAWGDVDLDGDLDAFVSGAYYPAGPRAARVYFNDEGGFEPGINLPGTLFGDAALGDYDRDGDLDVIISGVSALLTDITNLYVNTQRLLNDPPDPPAGLSSTVDQGEVVLSWSASTDDRPGPLTYNIRVGTTEDGIDIVQPNSVISSGHRFIEGAGNAMQNTGWLLRDLAPGTYWWSVQAIDGAHAASSFSPAQSFTVAAE